MVVKYKLYVVTDTNNKRSRLFTLLTAKEAEAACKNVKKVWEKKLVKWNFHHVYGGWDNDDVPKPTVYKCLYSEFPEEGLPKEEALFKLWQSAYWDRFMPNSLSYHVYVKMPGAGPLLPVHNDGFPQMFWKDVTVPRELVHLAQRQRALAETGRGAGYYSIHRAFSGFLEEYDTIIDTLKSYIPQTIFEHQNKDQEIEAEEKVRIGLRNIQILRAMIQDFARNTMWNIHNYCRRDKDKLGEKGFAWSTNGRYEYKFNDRYLKLGFLEDPMPKAPTEAERNAMQPPWVEEAISMFSKRLRERSPKQCTKALKSHVFSSIPLLLF